jgi:hypothetical protein
MTNSPPEGVHPYATGYPFRLHFTDANDAEVTENGQILGYISEMLHEANSSTIQEILNEIKSLLQEIPQERVEGFRSQPVELGHMGFDISTLLTFVPNTRWPRPNQNFICPNPYCTHRKKVDSGHLFCNHAELNEDGIFHDPLFTTIMGLIGVRANLSDMRDFACPYYKMRCDYKADSWEDLIAHQRTHTREVRMFSDTLGYFWGPILLAYYTSKEWGAVGDLLVSRIPDVCERITPTDVTEAEHLWFFGTNAVNMPDSITVQMIQDWHRQGSGTAGTDAAETDSEEIRAALAAEEAIAAQAAENEGPHFQIVDERTALEVLQPPRRRRRSAAPIPPINADMERPADFVPEAFHQEGQVEAEAEEEGPPRVLNINETLQQRIDGLLHVLTEPDQNQVAEDFEYLMGEYGGKEGLEEGLKFELDDPVVALLAYSECQSIFRAHVFCPYCGMDNFEDNDTVLLTHVKKEHSTDTACRDLITLFLKTLYTGEFVIRLRTETGELINREWEVERCPHPGCNYFQEKRQNVEKHVKTHQEMEEDMEKLGWFWGAMRTMLLENPETTIREAIGEGRVFQCAVAECGKIFSKPGNVSKHFSHTHPKELMRNHRAPTTTLFQTVEENVPPPEVVPEVITMRDMLEINRRAKLLIPPNPLPDLPPPIDSREMERHKMRRVREFIRKRDIHMHNTGSGVNIPKLTKKDMIKVRVGLLDLFEHEINPLMKEFQPENGDWDGWLAFEGAYEESLHLIRMHIVKALDLDPKGLYGARRVSPKTLEKQEKMHERRFRTQDIQRKLSKLRLMLEQYTEYQEDTPQNRRKQQKLSEQINEMFRMITPETRQRIFGDDSNDAVWMNLNTSTEHRKNVIEWLEAEVLNEASNEIKAMAGRFRTWAVQEAWSASPSICYNRYIDPQESPMCQIDAEIIQNHFRDTWGPPPEPFVEAEKDTPFFLEPRITEARMPLEMMTYMLKEENIRAVIRSRQDLSASGNDGISYRVIKGAGRFGVLFMKSIIEATIRCGKVFKTWKEGRTILLYKKGDRDDPKNWRPITITNCLYRAYTCLMARMIQETNKRCHIYSDRQKGFIQKSNGCSEHTIFLNELLHNANRKGRNLIITAIDFTNAFGSVPHELIMSTLKQRGFPEWMLPIINDMYTDAHSSIELKGRMTPPIKWLRGVKQGCPLSPLLFNLCLEPLIQAIESLRGSGVSVEIGINKFLEFLIQAYADDVIFMSEHPDGINEMLNTLFHFTRWSKMEVNPLKCSTISYLKDDNRRRAFSDTAFQFNDQEIPNLSLEDSMRYLGAPIAARRTVKLKTGRTLVIEAKRMVDKIMASPLKIVQKISAIKTKVLPSMDFMLMNGEIGTKDLTVMDKMIRGKLMDQMKIRGMPVECVHGSWKDGGLSLPALVDRKNVLIVRSLIQMMMSNDKPIRIVMQKFLEDERSFRQIPIDEDGSYFNWQYDGYQRSGTSSIIARAREAARNLHVTLKLKDEVVQMKTHDTPLEERLAEGLGRFLTQKVIRPQIFNSLMTKLKHGATFATLEDNDCSNKILTDVKSFRSDAFFRFTVAARADCLPTPANVSQWLNKDISANCFKCETKIGTLAHILNACDFPAMTGRHNKVVDVVYKEIQERIPQKLESTVLENVTLEIEGLSERTKSQKPDIHFRIIGNQAIFIDVSCPYGRITYGDNSLEVAYEEKIRKYTRLATEVRNLTGTYVTIIPVIVSSLGAVYPPSLDSLKALLNVDKKTIQKIGRKLSEAAIEGSFDIWRKYMKDKTRTGVDQVDMHADLEIEIGNTDTRQEAEVQAHDANNEPLFDLSEEVEGHHISVDEDEDEDEGGEADDEGMSEESEPTITDWAPTPVLPQPQPQPVRTQIPIRTSETVSDSITPLNSSDSFF